MGNGIDKIALILHFCTIDSSGSIITTICSISCFNERVLSTICGKKCAFAKFSMQIEENRPERKKSFRAVCFKDRILR